MNEIRAQLSAVETEKLQLDEKIRVIESDMVCKQVIIVICSRISARLELAYYYIIFFFTELLSEKKLSGAFLHRFFFKTNAFVPCP